MSPKERNCRRSWHQRQSDSRRSIVLKARQQPFVLKRAPRRRLSKLSQLPWQNRKATTQQHYELPNSTLRHLPVWLKPRIH
ncbi:unnamed protein product [Soboliphyme baturini]|uniref:Uncharacterized protein n=1 Tax=Soboliphyme baturini TaxID=241478 RepID=A0A183JA01_9BILA|nr:unnamed protein product [Soboliphyme baturini]